MGFPGAGGKCAASRASAVRISDTAAPAPAQVPRTDSVPTPPFVQATEIAQARHDHRGPVRLLEQPRIVAYISAGPVPYAEALFDDGVISRRNYAPRSDQQADRGTLLVEV
jgi:hypothetical protein